MLDIIKRHLSTIINNIDSGNSNITEEDEIKLINDLNRLTNKDEGISKYTACQYLNVHRATFDNYIRAGRIPKGKHIQGFKELRWYKKDLDKFLNEVRHENNK
jgi:excisionase family DNA binding protein